MIITLKGADFSGSNIGKLSTWTIFTTLGSGATYSGVKTVDRGASYSGTVTLADGYEVGSAGVTVKMGSTDVTSSAVTTSGSTITITIAAVTGTVYISVPTKNTATGEEDDGGEKTVADYIVDPWACWSDGKESATSGYYSVVDYPVDANAKYTIPYGRNYFFEDANHAYISGGSGGASATLQITTPSNAAYLTICFKPDDISADAVTITKGETVDSGDSSGGTGDTGEDENTEQIADGTVIDCGDVSGTVLNGAYYASSTASAMNTGSTNYFLIKDISVEANTTYNAPYARNTAFFTSDGTWIKGASGGGSSTATLTTPENAATMDVTYKYADLNPDEVSITKA